MSDPIETTPEGTEPAEDTQGHMPRIRIKAADETPDAPAPTAPADDEDDAEGHRTYARSDRDAKTDIVPVTWDAEPAPAADTEGHMPRVRTRAVDQAPDEPAPAAPAPSDEDDAEGHKIYSRSDRDAKTAIVPVTCDAPAR